MWECHSTKNIHIIRQALKYGFAFSLYLLQRQSVCISAANADIINRMPHTSRDLACMGILAFNNIKSRLKGKAQYRRNKAAFWKQVQIHLNFTTCQPFTHSNQQKSGISVNCLPDEWIQHLRYHKKVVLTSTENSIAISRPHFEGNWIIVINIGASATLKTAVCLTFIWCLFDVYFYCKQQKITLSYKK